MTLMHVWYMYTAVICSTGVSMKSYNLIQDTVTYRNELNEIEKKIVLLSVYDCYKCMYTICIKIIIIMDYSFNV